MKLLRIVDSPKEGKKLRAVFNNNGRTKNVDFGAIGMDDYTLTHDKAQRDRYRFRHAKDLKTGEPWRAGYLSYYVLWGDSTSRRENIKAYRDKFGL
jgi:hypothetical protein